MAGEFDQLFACSWRGIQFPTTSVECTFQQDLAEHRYYGVDGARVESTGRGPMNITVTSPLVNGIVPGANENWGVLYPTVFRELFTAVKNRKVGTLRHPELDQIECKVRNVEFRHTGEQRDGVVLVVHFVETNVDDLEVEFASPVTVAHLAALDLTASDEDFRGLVPTRPEMPIDATEFLRNLAGAFDRVSTASERSKNVLNRYRFHAERVQQSAIKAKNAMVWPTIDATERIKSALRWVEEHPPAGRPIIQHRVTKDVSVSVLLLELPSATLSELLKLNPRIAGRPLVASGTSVRYYAPR